VDKYEDIKNALDEILQDYKFEFNDEHTREVIKHQVTSYLKSVTPQNVGIDINVTGTESNCIVYLVPTNDAGFYFIERMKERGVE